MDISREQLSALVEEFGGLDGLTAEIERRRAQIRVDPTGFSHCRALRLRALTQIDEDRTLSRSDLATWVAAQDCSARHRPLPIGALDPDLTATTDGAVKLSAGGEDWLLTYGRPAPNWAADVPARLPPLRKWQIEALDAWAAHGRVGVVQAVTGTGKSRVGIEAAREALRHDYNVVVCVPTVDLVTQWAKTFRDSALPGVGMLGGGSKASFDTHNIIVGTVQSLYRRPPVRSDGKVLLIADECHRYGSEKWKEALDDSYRARLGLTATLERDDGIFDLYAYFGGSAVYDIGFDRAIADGVVAHYDVKLLGVSLTPREQAEYDEFQETLVESRRYILEAGMGVPGSPFGEYMKAVALIADDLSHPLGTAARQYLKAFSDRGEVIASAHNKTAALKRLTPMIDESTGTLVFNSRVDACEHLAEVLNSQGINASAVYGDHPDREDILRRFRGRHLKALVAPRILDEGIDVPHVDLGIVTAGSKSRRQMIQRMGRVLRLKDGNRKASFVVMYARGTNEDLTQASIGADRSDGFLGLITESADSVTQI